jgi:hypothetical protein
MVSSTRILNPAPPNLPLGTDQYERRYQDQFTNVLRLYFNQLRNALAELLGDTGGKYIGFPHISASSSQNQYATAANTPTKVSWNTLETIEGFTLDPTGYASNEFAGVYKIEYGLQFSNTDNAIHYTTVWLRVNGTDVPLSAVKFSLPARKSAGVPFTLLAFSSIVFPVNAGDKIELWWATEQAATSGGAAGVYMQAEAASSSPYVRPSIPSAIGAITFVSALPT